MTSSHPHAHSSYTHPKDCADHKEAAADRKSHDAAATERERRQQIQAQAVWLEWSARAAPVVLGRLASATRRS